MNDIPTVIKLLEKAEREIIEKMNNVPADKKAKMSQHLDELRHSIANLKHTVENKPKRIDRVNNLSNKLKNQDPEILTEIETIVGDL